MLGRDFASYILEAPSRFAAVTIYSAKSLEIRTPHTVETTINSTTSAYGYRYDGLRLMLYANAKYVLFDTRQPAGEAIIVVLPDESSIRVEFTRR